MAITGPSYENKYPSDEQVRLANEREEMQAQLKRQRQGDKKDIENLEENYRATFREQEQEWQDTVDIQRENYDEQFKEVQEQHKGELLDVKRQTYDRHGRYFDQEIDSLKEQLRLAHEADEERIEQADRQVKAKSAEIQDIAHHINREANDSMAVQVAAHKEQINALREDLKNVQAIKSAEAELKGEQIVDAYADIESESNANERRIVSAYEEQQKKLREQIGNQEVYMSRLKNKALLDKDLFYSKAIRRANLDNHNEKQDLAETFRHNIEQAELLRKKDNERSAERLEDRLTQANLDKSNALEDQTVAFQKTLGEQRTSYEDQIRQLERTLLANRTTNDPNNISPSAEATIRDQMTREQMKRDEAEEKRNREQIDSLQRTYSRRVTDTVQDTNQKLAIQNQAHVSELNSQRNAFVNHVQEAEERREIHAREQESAHAREMNKVNHAFSRALDRQRNRYEQLLQQLKLDTEATIKRERQENDFEKGMMRRQFAADSNASVRSYERQLAKKDEAKQEEFEALKSENRNQIRDIEKRTGEMLKQQENAYEQRLSQLEFQQEERVRVLRESFERERENLERTNRLLALKAQRAASSRDA